MLLSRGWGNNICDEYYFNMVKMIIGTGWKSLFIPQGGSDTYNENLDKEKGF